MTGTWPRPALVRIEPPRLGPPGATVLRLLRLTAIWYAAGTVFPGLLVALSDLFT